MSSICLKLKRPDKQFKNNQEKVLEGDVKGHNSV